MSEAPPTRITSAIIMNEMAADLIPTWEGCFRLKYVFSMCLMVLYMYRVIRSPTVLSTTRFNGIPRRAQNMQKSRPPNVRGTICPKPKWRRDKIRNKILCALYSSLWGTHFRKHAGISLRRDRTLERNLSSILVGYSIVRWTPAGSL